MTGKISEDVDAGTLDGTEIVPVVKSGNKRTLVSAIKTYILAAVANIYATINAPVFTGGINVGGNSNFQNNLTLQGSALSTSPSGGVGYATGAGGTVTQGTSRSTAVTLNTVTGAITMFTAAPTLNTPVTFNLNNSAIAATDVVAVSVKSTTNNYQVWCAGTAAGVATIGIMSVAGTASDAPVINFAIIKGATA